MNFSYFSNLASGSCLCRKSDFLRLTREPHVKKMIEGFRAGNEAAKRNLPAFCFHATFKNNKRKAEFATPSGLVMLDLDKVAPEILQELIHAVVPREEERDTTPILLVHITPSGKGLRIVFKATRTGIFADCRSMADYQHVLAQQLHVEAYLDTVCTDLARLSFCPMYEEVLYLNDRLFTDTAEVTDFAASHSAVLPLGGTPLAVQSDLFPDSKQDRYEGIPLQDIFSCYIDLTGGIPERGARNSRYYAAARDLRYICDFNPKVMSRFLPDCGLSPGELLSVCHSAVQSTRAVKVPELVLQAVKMARAFQEDEAEMSEEETQTVSAVTYDKLPRLFHEFVEAAPEDFREATILALLPIVGTLATRVRAKYIDGEIHSPSFFTVVTAEQASGKSFVRKLVRQLLVTIAEEDARERKVEQDYREELKQLKNAKEQPTPPRVKIRLVPASISIARLLQRLDAAEQDHLFSFAEEMDTLIKSNKSGAWSEKNDLYRYGFDNAEYGQDFMSEASYSATVKVFYNLLILGTPRQTAQFFSNIENGMLSRCCLASVPDQFGAKMPKFKQMDANTLLRIDVYVKRLREAQGEIDLSFLHEPLAVWLEDERVKAIEENNRARDIFRRRSAVIAFRSALTIAPLYKLNKEGQQVLTDFALRMAKVVLKNQLDFAGPRLNALIDNSVPGTGGISANIFSCLPDTFTVHELNAELRRHNMSTPARKVVYRWKKNGLIEKNDMSNYTKIKKEWT